MSRFLPCLVVPGLLLGSVAASAQSARVAPPWSESPQPAFVAPRWLAELTQGPPNGGVSFTGDVDNDGDVDLLAYGSGFQIWKNDGGGHFTYSHTFAPTSIGRDFQLADITGDGVLDIVHVDLYIHLDGSIRVHPGLGDGHFGAEISFSNFVLDIFPGDGDGDGDLDLLVYSEARGLAWYRYEGGGFVSWSSIPVASETLVDLTALDIEGDGVADAVGFSSDSSSYFLRFLRTTGGVPTLDALLPLPAELQIGNRTLDVCDLDGDGDDDVLVVAEDVNNDRFLSQPVWNEPTGFTLAPLQILPNSLGQTPYYLKSNGRFVDWDEDGDADYVSPSFVWMENTGDAVFAVAANVYWRAVNSGPALHVADFDSDGHLDALARWACLFGDGDFPSRVSNPEREPVSGWAGWSVLEDWEGDGDLDFVGSRKLSLNNGEGSFVSRTTEPPTEDIQGILLEKAWGDFDGDGFRDLVMAEDIYPDGFERMLLFTGTEDGTYILSETVPSPIEMSTPDNLAGDLDGDGDVDILTRHGFWANDGEGRFGTSVVVAYNGSKPWKALDLEGDGDLDLLVTGLGAGSNLRLLRNQGGLVFTTTTLGPSTGLSVPSFLDVDEDGDLDLVTTHDTGLVKVFEQLPGGGFAPPMSLAAPGVAGPAGMIDVDGDHRRDLVASRSFDGFGTSTMQILSVWTRGPGLTFDGPHEWAVPEAPRGYGDIDRDGDVEPLGAASFENLRQDGPSDGFALQYGLDAATAGTGGIHPVLGSGAPARPGRLAELVIGRGRGGAFGVLLAGDERDDVVDGGFRRLVASPSTPRSFVLEGTPGAPGEGALALSVNVVSALIGRTRTFQVVLVDPGATSGLSATNGLEVRFGD